MKTEMNIRSYVRTQINLLAKDDRSLNRAVQKRIWRNSAEVWGSVQESFQNCGACF